MNCAKHPTGRDGSLLVCPSSGSRGRDSRWWGRLGSAVLLAFSIIVAGQRHPARGDTIAPLDCTVLASIIVGNENTEILDGSCEDCGDASECQAGFGFVGADGSVGFYDYTHNNIKVFGGKLGPYDRMVIVEGYPIRPVDATVDAAGNILILIDRFAAGLSFDAPERRYLVAQRSLTSTVWSVGAEIPNELGHGPRRVGGKNVYAYGAVRMWHGRFGSNAVVIASDTREVVVSQHGVLVDTASLMYTEIGQSLDEIKRVGTNRREVKGGSSLVDGMEGRRISIGEDSKGNWYTERLLPPSDFAIDRCSHDGTVLVSALEPKLPQARWLSGKGMFFASVEGDVIAFQITHEALVIWRCRFPVK